MVAATFAPPPAFAQEERSPGKQQTDRPNAGPQPDTRSGPHLEKRLSPAEQARNEKKLLGSLLDRLATSEDEESAKILEDAVLKAWLRSGSATIDLLMQEAVEATNSKKYDVARKLLDAVVDLAPNYAEGWNKRATLSYLEDDYGGSAQDIKKALDLEPRHFGALSGLGMIMRELGDDGGALAAFREALKYHPFLHGAREAVKSLKEIVEGREI